MTDTTMQPDTANVPPMGPDQGWDKFVDQQTQKTQQEASDPKWQDFIQSHSDQAITPKTPPPTTVGETAGAMIKPMLPAMEAITSHIMGALQPPQVSPEVSDDAAKFRNSKDFKEGAANFAQLANDAVLKPAVQSFTENFIKPYQEQVSMADEALKQAVTPYSIDQLPTGEPVTSVLKTAFMDIPGALMGEVSARLGLSGAMQAASTPLLGHEKAAEFGSEVGILPFIAEGAIRTAGTLPNTLARAKGSGALDGEEAYFGTKELPPEQQVTIDVAQEATQPSVANQNVPTFDIHEAARNVAPEAIDSYHRLQATQDTLRSQLNDLKAEKTSDLDKQISEIQEAKKGGYGKLQSLIAKRDDLSSQDTLEESALRRQIQENDYKMRDLAPQVSEAYRTASEFAPEERTPEAEAQETAPEAVQPTAKPMEEQRQAIISDISQKLTAIGRPQEEIDAASQLEAARYQTLAEQYPKFSAEEWYNRESANIQAGKERARLLAQKGELGQVRSPAYEEISRRLEGEGDKARTPRQWIKRIGDFVGNDAQTAGDINELHSWLESIIQENSKTRVPASDLASFVNEKIESGELEQPMRGKIRLATDNAKATITLMKNANASTLIHEKGHEWTDQLLRLSAEDDAPAQMKADAETLRKYGGAGEDGILPTRGHEKIARGFERYLMEGTAPSRGLAAVFAKFKAWLTSIYKTVENLKSPISDDIRDVFDRFLSSNPEKTTIAPDHEPGAMLANIHERDAAETPPEKAVEVADNVIKEIKSTAKLHGDKEAQDVISAAEASGSSANIAGAESTPTNAPTEEPPEVSASSSATEPEGNAARTEPTTSTEPAATTTEPATGNGTESAEPNTGTGISDSSTTAREAPEGEPASPTSQLEAKPYFIDKKGVINFDLFKTPEDIQRYLQEWADKNPDKISEARGGKVTLDQTVKLAQSMGMTVEDLKARKVGELYDGPKQVAAAQLFIQSSKRIKDAADAARASGDPQKVANFFADLEDHKDFMDMFLQQVGISAEASRALGSRRAIRQLSGFQEAMDIGELFQRMTGVNMKDAKAQADLFASLDSPEKIAKLAQKTREADWRDYAIAYRNNDILSGPVTHLHYADGNLVNLLYKPSKVAVASLLPGGPELGEAGAMFNSIVMGAQKGWQVAKAAWQDGIDKSYQDTIENYKRPTQVSYNPTFNKYLGPGSPVGRSIGAIHSFFYTMNMEQVKAQLAFRQALTEGLQEKTNDFNNRVSDLITNPTKEMMAKADADAKESMYLKNPEYGSALYSLNQFANRSYVGRALIPFAKISMNVKLLARDNTVLGLFNKDVRADLMGVNGSEARAIRIASMGMGTSMFGISMAAGNLINGNGPSDPKSRNIWLLTHTPNSIQIGNIAVPLAALGTPGVILMAGAEMREAFQDATDEESQKASAAFMQHVSQVLFEGTFIQNTKNTVDALFHPEEYGSQFLQNTFGGLVPYSSFLGQVNRYIDPFRRDVHSHGLENVFGITDYIKSRVPFASETLPERVDALGNPIPNDRWFAAGSYSRYVSNPIVQKLGSLGIGITKPKRDIMSIPLTEQQYHDYSVTAGQLVQKNLEWIVQSPYFDQMPRPAQMKEVNRAIGEAHKYASQEMMFLNPEIMQKAAAKKEAAMH